ncbi:MAG: hypothetical protein ACLTYW_02675 [Collinsella sp.]
MRKIVSVLSAAVLTLTLCACSSGSSTSSITVAGSTTCLPIAEIAAEGFKEETGTTCSSLAWFLCRHRGCQRRYR